MNRLLRYTHLIFAFLVVSLGAWGQTTYTIQSGEVTLDINQSRTHDNLPAVPLASMSITIKKSRATSIGKTQIYYNNSEVKSLSASDVTTSYKTFSGISLNGIGGTIKVEFPTGGSYKRVYKDLIVTQQRYLRFADGTTANKALDWGTLRVGTSAGKSFNVDYSDVLVSAAISGDGASHFSVSDASFGNNSGAYDPNRQLTVTYSPTAVGTHSATLTLTAANGNVIRVNLSGTANSQVNPIITGSNKLDAKVGTPYTADFAFSNVTTATPSANPSDAFYYTIEHHVTTGNTVGSPDATKVISYDPSTNLVTPLNEGQAVVSFTQRETSEYYAAEVNFTVTVSKQVNVVSIQGYAGNSVTIPFGKKCAIVTSNDATRPAIVLNQTSGLDFAVCSADANDPYIQTLFSNGQATFTVSQAEDYKYQAASAMLTVHVAQVSEAASFEHASEESINVYGGTHTYDIPYYPDKLYIDIKKQGAGTGNFVIKYCGETIHEFAAGDLSTNYTQYVFELDHNKRGTLEITAGGTLNKHYCNLVVTRYTYLNAPDDLTINALEGQQASDVLTVDWCLANGGPLLVYNDNPTDFTCTPVSFGTENEKGTTQLTVSFNEQHDHSTSVANLVIYNDVYMKRVTVTGNTLWKPATGARYRIQTGENFLTVMSAGTTSVKPGANYLLQAFAFNESAANQFRVAYTDAEGAEQTLYESATTVKHNGVWTVMAGGNAVGTIAEAARYDCSLHVTGAGWATFIAPYRVELPSDVTAYQLTGARVCDKLKLQQVAGNYLAAHTPYIIKATGGAHHDYSDYGTATTDSYVGGGGLTGTYVEHTTVADEYVLQQHASGTGFFLVDDVTPTVHPSRCYIAAQGASPIRGFVFGDDDELGFIGDDLTGEPTDADVIYTLSGVRIHRADRHPGLYIINGKKVMIK